MGRAAHWFHPFDQGLNHLPIPSSSSIHPYTHTRTERQKPSSSTSIFYYNKTMSAGLEELTVASTSAPCPPGPAASAAPAQGTIDPETAQKLMALQIEVSP